MTRGFNLSGWLDGATPRRPDDAALTALRQRGFTHVRLPVNADHVMEALSGRAQVADRLRDLDDAIDRLIGLGFAVSLDLHPGGNFNRLHRADPARGFGLIRATWSMLARRYESRSPDRLFFELLNEPAVDPAIWNEQGPRLVEALRREAPRRTIVYGPADFQQIGALAAMAPLPDQNVVYAVHYYAPMIFTHQGLDWSDDPLRDLHDVPFPARASDPVVEALHASLVRSGKVAAAAQLKSQLREPWTEVRVGDEIAKAGAWSAVHRRPVIVNEFGVLRWKAPAADRTRWLAAVRGAAERACLGWAHWDYADAFGMMRRIGDREVPDPATIEALIGTGAKTH